MLASGTFSAETGLVTVWITSDLPYALSGVHTPMPRLLVQPQYLHDVTWPHVLADCMLSRLGHALLKSTSSSSRKATISVCCALQVLIAMLPSTNTNRFRHLSTELVCASGTYTLVQICCSGTLDVTAVPWAMMSSSGSLLPHLTQHTFAVGPHGSRSVLSLPLDDLVGGCNACDPVHAYFLVLNASAGAEGSGQGAGSSGGGAISSRRSEELQSVSSSSVQVPAQDDDWRADLQLITWDRQENVSVRKLASSTDAGLHVGTAQRELRWMGAATGLMAAQEPVMSVTTLWLTEMKDVALPQQPGLTVSHIFQTASSAVSFQVACDKVAVMVLLDAWPIQGHFSDNLFTCIPGPFMHVTFDADTDISMHDFKQALAVHSLADTLQT